MNFPALNWIIKRAFHVHTMASFIINMRFVTAKIFQYWHFDYPKNFRTNAPSNPIKPKHFPNFSNEFVFTMLWSEYTHRPHNLHAGRQPVVHTMNLLSALMDDQHHDSSLTNVPSMTFIQIIFAVNVCACLPLKYGAYFLSFEIILYQIHILTSRWILAKHWE